MASAPDPTGGKPRRPTGAVPKGKAAPAPAEAEAAPEEPKAGKAGPATTSRRRRGGDEGGEEKGAGRAGRASRRGGDEGEAGGEGAPGRGAGRDLMRPEGLSLAVKFAAMISATLFVVMVIFSIFTYNTASGAIQQQIEEDGVVMVSLAAQVAEEYYFASRFNEVLHKGPGVDPADRREAEEKWRRERDRLNLRFNGHLRHLREMEVDGAAEGQATTFQRVIAVTVLQPQPSGKSTVVISGGDIGSGWSPARTETFLVGDRKSDIEIVTGEMKSNTPMVLFRKPVYNRFDFVDKKSETGWTAHVFLNAAQISAARKRLFGQIVIWLILGIVAGVGIAWPLSGRVTAPVKQLIADIGEVAAGNLKHRTTAHSKDEIGVLARAFDQMTQSLQVAYDKEVENQQRAHELNIATEIQANLLPKKIPRLPGLDMDAFYRPSKEVGGDYYDFIQIDETHLGLIVADVSGKGIPGSMVMTMARSLIRMEAQRNLSAKDTLIKVNRIISADIRRGMFVTAIYAILDIPNRTILVSSAGHNPMVIWRKESNGIQLVNPNGIALGFDRGPIFERTVKEQLVRLLPGDRVVMYTDGVVESMNAANEEFTDKRFYQLVQKVAMRNSNQFVNIVVGKLDEHQGASEQHDDITILTLMVE